MHHCWAVDLWPDKMLINFCQHNHMGQPLIGCVCACVNITEQVFEYSNTEIYSSSLIEHGNDVRVFWFHSTNYQFTRSQAYPLSKHFLLSDIARIITPSHVMRHWKDATQHVRQDTYIGVIFVCYLVALGAPGNLHFMLSLSFIYYFTPSAMASPPIIYACALASAHHQRDIRKTTHTHTHRALVHTNHLGLDGTAAAAHRETM